MIPAPAQNLQQQLDSATWGQVVLWLALGIVFAYLGFRRGKGFLWRILGVFGVLNILLSLGIAAKRIGRTAQPAASPQPS